MDNEEISYLFRQAQSGHLIELTNAVSYLNEFDDLYYVDNEKPLGSISPSDLSFNIYLVGDVIDTETKQIGEVHAYISFSWHKIPYNKKCDAVIVNWDPNVLTYKAGSFKSTSTSESLNGLEPRRVTTELTTPNQVEQGGLGYDVQLSMLGGPLYPYNPDYISGGSHFSFFPAKPFCNIPNHNMTVINTQYRHNRNPFVSNIGFTVSGVSVGFDLSAFTDTTTYSANIAYAFLE